MTGAVQIRFGEFLPVGTVRASGWQWQMSTTHDSGNGRPSSPPPYASNARAHTYRTTSSGMESWKPCGHKLVS